MSKLFPIPKINCNFFFHSVCEIQATSDGLEYKLRNDKTDTITQTTPHDIAVKLFENLYGK